MHIRKSKEADFAAMLAIINNAARAYRGVIPADRWHEPYMSADELEREIAEGVLFWVAEEKEHLTGLMGIQDKGDVVHGRPERRKRPPASDVLVNPGETDRDLRRSCQRTMDGSPSQP